MIGGELTKYLQQLRCGESREVRQVVVAVVDVVRGLQRRPGTSDTYLKVKGLRRSPRPRRSPPWHRTARSLVRSGPGVKGMPVGGRQVGVSGRPWQAKLRPGPRRRDGGASRRDTGDSPDMTRAWRSVLLSGKSCGFRRLEKTGPDLTLPRILFHARCRASPFRRKGIPPSALRSCGARRDPPYYVTMWNRDLRAGSDT